MPEQEQTAVSHTPGPWKLTGDSQRSPYFKIRGTRLGGKWKVANCPFIPEVFLDMAEAAANARLIAAAPDLLAALELMPLEHFADEQRDIDAAEFVDHANDFMNAMRAGRAAIAKALNPEAAQ